MNLPNDRASKRPPRGFTVVELMVVMAVVGVLLGLILPAVGAAREASRRVVCVNRLHQIGLAAHQHHNIHNSLPIGWKIDPSRRWAIGWAVELLPYLEQSELRDQVRRDPFYEFRRIDDPSLDAVGSASLSTFLCPSDIAPSRFALYGETTSNVGGESFTKSELPELLLTELPTANYVGVFGTIEPDDSIPAPIGDGPFLENKATRFRDFTRGLAHTMLVGERTFAQVPSTWLGIDMRGEDAAARIVGAALEGINQPLADESDFSSRHPGGAHFVWADGHVSLVDQHIALEIYHDAARLRHSHLTLPGE